MTREEAIIFVGTLKTVIKDIPKYNGAGIDESIDMAIKALEQESCEDAISKQAVLDGIDNYIEKAQSTGTKDDFISFEELVVKALPSVTPKQKMGRWIEHNHHGIIYTECSNCSARFLSVYTGRNRYCPHCGAKMVDPQESEGEK